MHSIDLSLAIEATPTCPTSWVVQVHELAQHIQRSLQARIPFIALLQLLARCCHELRWHCRQVVFVALLDGT